jgi:MSHA biogenesis protein MshK
VYKWLICVTFICASVKPFAETESGNEPRDPTTPLGYTAGDLTDMPEQNFILDSVLIGSHRKLAIINGNSLREGQQIPGSGGIKVRRILPQKVILQQGGNIWSITLSPDVIKRH